MSVAARLAAFAGVLALVLTAGLGLGRAVGPVEPTESRAHGEAPAAHGATDGADNAAHGGSDAGHGGDHDEQEAGVTGLAVSEDGYALRPLTRSLAVGPNGFRFVVEGPDGPLTEYDVTHERELHLVVVRRDGTGFQHLHPERAADGSWSTPLTLATAGAYRAYADFAPAGEPARTLAVDLLVPGDFVPQPLPAPAEQTSVDDLDVALVDGHLTAGEEATLAFEVTRAGRPVDLEPYLGATGHLVVLREGDLGYLHVHAEDGALAFATTAPTAGTYRLYLQVSVDGVVRTAELTAEAEEEHA